MIKNQKKAVAIFNAIVENAGPIVTLKDVMKLDPIGVYINNNGKVIDTYAVQYGDLTVLAQANEVTKKVRVQRVCW